MPRNAADGTCPIYPLAMGDHCYGGDEGFGAVHFGVAFGEDADCSQVIFLELVGQVGEPPAEHHHLSGGEREREFLRWCVLVIVVASIRVGLHGVFDQLAGVKSKAHSFEYVPT